MAAFLQSPAAVRCLAARIPRSRRPAVKDWSGSLSSFQRPRHDRVARALVTGAIVATFGCSTTHQLGRVADEGTVEALEDAALGPGATLHVEPLPGERAPTLSRPIRSLTTEGIVLDEPGPPVVVPLARVRSVSTNDRARGARRGALGMGLVGLLVGAALSTYVVVKVEHAQEDGSATATRPVPFVLGVSAVSGLASALIGAGLGALAGSQDRYVVTRD
jgi:hypothetical protein